MRPRLRKKTESRDGKNPRKTESHWQREKLACFLNKMVNGNFQLAEIKGRLKIKNEDSEKDCE